MAVNKTSRSNKPSGLTTPLKKKTKSNRLAAKKCRDKKNRAYEELKKYEASLKEENARLKVEKECLSQQIGLLEEMGDEKEEPIPVTLTSNKPAGLVAHGSHNSNAGLMMVSDNRHHHLSSLIHGHQEKQARLYSSLFGAAAGPMMNRMALLQTPALAAPRTNAVQQQQHVSLLNRAAVPGRPHPAAPVNLGDPSVLTMLAANKASINHKISLGRLSMFL